MLDIDKFYDMLRYRRPAGSKSERRFIGRFIDSVPGMESDPFGNRYIALGEEEPTTMFSSHTDTVHQRKGRQELIFDREMGLVYSAKSNCLGADDTTGVFIMLNMIAKGIPGLYVFHREEEVGGGGSIYFAANMIHHWPHIQRCIAFDRLGYSSVITHQMGMRTASEEFAEALCLELGATWSPDDTGSFTDSDNYSEIIPECTNISVGYFNQHTTNEYQDVYFLEELLPILLEVDWNGLPAKRDPSIVEYDDWWTKAYSGTGSGSKKKVVGGDNWGLDWDTMPTTYQEVEEMLYADPNSAVNLICDLLDLRRDF